MVIMKKCISDRNYLLRYPEFAAEETGGKKERQAAFRMNDFYVTMKNEIIAYCAEITAEHPRAMYIMDMDCTVGGELLPFSESAAFAMDVPLVVHIALALRIRPEPTRHRVMEHTWQGGELVK